MHSPTHPPLKAGSPWGDEHVERRDRLADVPRVLLIDPDPEARARAARHCSGSRMVQLQLATDIDQAVASQTDADVILLDIAAVAVDRLPEHFERLRCSQSHPVGIAVTSPRDDLHVRVAAARAGADTFLVKPLGKQALRTTVQHLRQRTQPVKRRVLVIDDDPDFVAIAQMMLTRAGYSTVCLTDSEPILENLRRLRPDAVIVDLGMPRYDGIELTTMLRNSREFDNTPVLFVSGHRDRDSIRAAFAAGADDFLIKPISAADLALRIDARIERSRQLRIAAERDPLTGLLSRGPFEAALENRIASSIRNGTSLSLCLIDLDHFKEVNDAHGHQVGDEVLAAFGHLVRSEFRAEDLKCRWGGEEFALAFPRDHDISVCRALIERLLERFTALPFLGTGDQVFSVSFSAGIAQMTRDVADMDELIQVADQRLYRAKTAGRSRVVITG